MPQGRPPRRKEALTLLFARAYRVLGFPRAGGAGSGRREETPMIDRTSIDPVHELKTRAELLQHGAASGLAPAIERLRALPELRRAGSEALAAFAARLQRKHRLAAVAREAGFESWSTASRVLRRRSRGGRNYGETPLPQGVGRFPEPLGSRRTRRPASFTSSAARIPHRLQAPHLPRRARLRCRSRWP